MARNNGKKKNGNDDPGGAPAWMVTYGDMMSLLLTFFVLLLSFSVMDEKKVSQALSSIRGALGVLNGQPVVVNLSSAAPQRRMPRSIERIARQLRRQMQVLGREHEIGIDYDFDKGGLKINLPSNVLFDSGNAELRPDAYELLNEIGVALHELPGVMIEVRGHTDSRPIQSAAFRDNYDLSYERAKNVMLYMERVGPLTRDVFELVSLGPAQPVADNETDAGRQSNRRVEFFVTGDISEESAEGIEEIVNRFSQPVVVEGGS